MSSFFRNNPGSGDALALGCTCPPDDNNGGASAPMVGPKGGPMWWICEECPEHWPYKCGHCGDLMACGWVFDHFRLMHPDIEEGGFVA